MKFQPIPFWQFLWNWTPILHRFLLWGFLFCFMIPSSFLCLSPLVLWRLIGWGNACSLPRTLPCSDGSSYHQMCPVSTFSHCRGHRMARGTRWWLQCAVWASLPFSWSLPPSRAHDARHHPSHQAFALAFSFSGSCSLLGMNFCLCAEGERLRIDHDLWGWCLAVVVPLISIIIDGI